MKRISLIILLVVFTQSVFAQQIYIEEIFGYDSTPLDTTLYWYGIYPNPNSNPRIYNRRLLIKPVKITLKKDSICYRVCTDNPLISNYLIGFKKPIQIDSFPDFYFTSADNYLDYYVTAGSGYHYDMDEKGMLRMYANGIISRQEDSVAINNYDLLVEHQCHATPYMTMRGWQYNLSLDVYAPCAKESLNHFFDLGCDHLNIIDLPLYIGAIDLNQDALLDLIFLYKGTHYLLLTGQHKDSKKYIKEVKKMTLDWGFF